MYIHISMKLFLYPRNDYGTSGEGSVLLNSEDLVFGLPTDGRTDDGRRRLRSSLSRFVVSCRRRRSWTNQSKGKLREEEESISSVFFYPFLSLSLSLTLARVFFQISLSLSLFLSLKQSALIIMFYTCDDAHFPLI